MSSKSKVPPPPLLSRATSWTTERIATLSLAEAKGLRENATRLGETEIVALCDAAMTTLRRSALAARKALPQKPKPRKAPAAKVAEQE